MRTKVAHTGTSSEIKGQYEKCKKFVGGDFLFSPPKRKNKGKGGLR